MAAVLELGKHTLFGWFLTAPAVLGFLLISKYFLKDQGRFIRFLGWIGLILAFALILWISWPPVRSVPAVSGRSAGVTEVVHLKNGDLTGVLTEDGAVEVFAGIPYAKPPVGELRWREPEPAEPWEGVLQADHFAPMFMQSQNLPIYSSLAQIIGFHDYQISLHDNYRAPASEDALYLNLWKPAGEVSGLPVLVYIHGGSLQTGQPWYADYSGEALAREDVIVVNFAYRLGIFGFYADEALQAESPNGTTGNYGLLDQILALQWVQENIEAFGGDPANVTLSGESAGAACVTALCTSPLAEGLFRRAVAESSTVTAPLPMHSFRTMEEALEEGARTKERHHADDLSALRSIPAEKLASEMDYHHHMTIDGYVLPETPYEAYQEGRHHEEAQLQGYNRDEGAAFLIFSPANLKNYEEKVRAAFEEPYASEVLSLYPAGSDAEAKKNWEDIFSILFFSYGHYCWERQGIKAGIPVYGYHFTKENGRLGPWHSGEEVYLYGNIPADSGLYEETDRALSDIMKQYYVNFIRTGDPNGEGLPEWPKSDGTGRVLEFGEQIRVTDAPGKALYELLDRMYGFQK